jgi:hypothetical protein
MTLEIKVLVWVKPVNGIPLHITDKKIDHAHQVNFLVDTFYFSNVNF